VAAGNLVEQWQNELKEKFDLSFNILTRDHLGLRTCGGCRSSSTKKVMVAMAMFRYGIDLC
jgi:hypothetical protein